MNPDTDDEEEDDGFSSSTGSTQDIMERIAQDNMNEEVNNPEDSFCTKLFIWFGILFTAKIFILICTLELK